MIRSLVANSVVLSGVGCGVYGCYLLLPAAAWIVGGVITCVYGALLTVKQGGKEC